MKSIKYIILFLFVSININAQQHKEYHKNGDLWKVGTLENGKKVGEWTIYTSYAGIKFKKVGIYQNDLKNGLWKSYINDKLSSEGNYKKDKKEGQWKSYFSKEGTLKDIGSYSQDKKNGTWKSYHKKGSLSSIYNYKNGVTDGESLSYYENEQLWMKGNYVDGKKDGVWENYHKNGILNHKTYYKNDKIDGKHKSYHDNGKLSSSGMYINGKKNGKWKYFNDLGNIDFEGEYKDGKNSGKWIYYLGNGKLIASENFDTNNKFIQLNHYPKKELFYEELRKVLNHLYNYSEKKISLNLKENISSIVDEIGLINSDKNNGSLRVFIQGDKIQKIEKRFPNDKTQIEGTFLNSKKNGNWNYYDNNGKLKMIKTFSNGHLLETKTQ